jgi:hypothetical protein
MLIIWWLLGAAVAVRVTLAEAVLVDLGQPLHLQYMPQELL